MRNPLIVALDVPDRDRALRLVEELSGVVGCFKVGSELFTSVGPEIVREIRKSRASVFLDLKFHDIPATVSRAVSAGVRLDVQMLTIHTSGGAEMIRAAEDSARRTAGELGREAPLILGVTVLTSCSDEDLRELGIEVAVEQQVKRLAQLAVKAGLRGLVCSPQELPQLREILPDYIQLVTPGIRSSDEPRNDQKRTMSASEAIKAGANYIVVGRPICAALNPRAAAEKILSSIF